MPETKIQWTEAVWNPVTGCSGVSEGCVHCYARRLAEGRLRGRCGYPQQDPFRVTLHRNRLDQPLRWQRGRRIFVCSMGDLFHPDVPDSFILEMFDVMRRSAAARFNAAGDNLRDHIYMILTKRPERMQDFMSHLFLRHLTPPPPNLWLGISVENEARMAERWPRLERTPAALRFVSYEPALGLVDWQRSIDGIDWLIAGAETGPDRRPAPWHFFENAAAHCVQAGVPFFLKGMGRTRMGLGSIIRMPDNIGGRQWQQIPTPGRP